MRKVTMPNFYINFLNKTVKSLSILYDFAVASLADAWIKICLICVFLIVLMVASLADAWIKIARNPVINRGDIVASSVGAWIKTEQTVRL